MEPKIVLASSSPRRKELLSQLGITFEIIPPEVSEKGFDRESSEAYVLRIAELKAGYVAKKRKEAWVIGADTIVVAEDQRLGKPVSQAEARKMLGLLSGIRHEVVTGIAVICTGQNFREVWVEKTGVWFRKLGPEEIGRYISTSEPYDKAGGYGIQGGAADFIEKIEGDLLNVIGLPLRRLEKILTDAGLMASPRSSPQGLTAQEG